MLEASYINMNAPQARTGSSYRRILRTTSIFAGATGIELVLRVFRVKVLAVLLGPSGIGLMGMYGSILATATRVAGLGLGSAGTREIASARGENEPAQIHATVLALRIATVLLAGFGGGSLYVFRNAISRAVFGTADHQVAVAWLAIGVFCSVAGVSLHATIQGFQRIGDLAKSQVIGVVSGTVLGILLISLLRVDGVVWLVVSMPVLSLGVAWWFASRVKYERPVVSLGLLVRRLKPLLGLGTALLITGVLQSVVMLALRSKISRSLGLDATGQFQAAWAISFVYVGFLFQSMGKDYYPRLTAATQNAGSMTRLVNEQLRVSLLIAAPLLLGMMTVASIAIGALYSPLFNAAVPMLRWMLLATVLRVFAWAVGMVLLARGRIRLFVITEVFGLVALLVLCWVGVDLFGVVGAALGYVIQYLVYLPIVFVAVKSQGLQKIDRFNIGLLLTLAGSMVILFVLMEHAPLAGWTFGVAGTIGAGYVLYSQVKAMLGGGPLSGLFI